MEYEEAEQHEEDTEGAGDEDTETNMSERLMFIEERQTDTQNSDADKK